MNSKLLNLRNQLIQEAIRSPMLLSDLAGLEAYISESYNCRSFVELLQNADDSGASKFLVKRFGEYLLVANNGRPFNIQDMESLCRSASSNKTRGTSIGYRGIGFKSVVSIAKEVHLISGGYEVTFSKELSKYVVPQAIEVPLIRIPHDIKHSIKAELYDTILNIQNDYTTLFIFSGVIADQIDEEYTHFANTTLLFLNNIRTININLNEKISTSISVIDKDEIGKRLRVSSSDSISDWFVCSDNNCSIAFSMENGKIVRLSKENAIIHAFLPTEDSCGFGIVINGDYSTDPSRRHLIFDESTQTVIVRFIKLYINLLKHSLNDRNSEMLNALMPYFDLKLVQLARNSFEKEFSTLIMKKFGNYFANLKLAPTWFNNTDYSKIMEASRCPYIALECCEVVGLETMLKYLGCKIDNIDNIILLVMR